MDQPSEKELTASYKGVFTSSEGGVILEDLVERFYNIVTYEPGIDYTVSDTVYYEGCRAVLEYIQNRVNETMEDKSQQTGDYI